MQVKNLTNHDISFMFTSPKSTDKMPVFETVNIVAGWTVLISDDIWNEIKKQTKTVLGFTEEVVEISEGGAHVRSNGGEKTIPTKTIRQWDGTSKEVNLVDYMVKNRELEVIETNDEPQLPDRSVLESFLKRFGVKGLDKLTDEEVVEKVKEVKAELAAIDSL